MVLLPFRLFGDPNAQVVVDLLFRIYCAQTDDAVRCWIRIGIHQRGVDQAGDCSRRADAQRQRDYSRYGEPEVPDELACCVTEILKQGLHDPFLAARSMQSMLA